MEKRDRDYFLHITSRRYTFDLDIESTHGQPASCRARLVNVDDHLKNSLWIHGVGGEIARGVLRTLLKHAEMSIFCQRRGIEIFCGLLSIHERPNLSSLRRLPCGRHMSPAVV